MKFYALQENLRKYLLARIEQGSLTGLGLAQQTGFQQAHISNFLNRKRGLSLAGMDRILDDQKLSVVDLLEPAELRHRVEAEGSTLEHLQSVMLVDAKVAVSQPMLTVHMVKDTMKFKKSFLRQMRAASDIDRGQWERFVLMEAPAREAMSMYPRLLPGALVMLDRHYTSLKPYHKTGPNMYAVNHEGGARLKYVEVAGDRMVLRPHNPAYPVEVIPLPTMGKANHSIVGRICYVGLEP